MRTDDIQDRNQKLVWLADEHELGFTRKMAAQHLRCGQEQAAYFVRQALKCGVLVRVNRPPEVRYCRPEAASVSARKANVERTLSERSATVERTPSECSADVQLPTPTPTPTPKEEISEANASSSAGPTAEPSEPPAKPKTDSLPNCPADELIAVYHETLPELPRVRLKTPDRVRLLSKAWRWVLTSKRPDNTRRAETPAEAVEWFRGYFAQVRDNDFLMGRVERSGAHRNWSPDIDYLLSDRGMKLVIEKTYANEVPA